MAFRELHVVEMREILRLWSRGRGFRTVANRVGVDRKTVRRYVEAARKAGLERGGDVDDQLLGQVAVAVRPGAPVKVGPMREVLRQDSEALKDWAKAGCQGPKLVKLFKRKTGVVVPLRTMQRFVAEDLDLGKDTSTVRIVDPEPGVLEVDFLELGRFMEIGTGKVRKMHALLCVASCSRHMFVWPCLSQTFEDVVEGLEAAWTFFGGVFPILLPDNTSAIVKKADPIAPLFTDAFIEYAQKRGFEVDPARVRKPKDKARVERQVRYVRGDYFSGEDFRSIEEARAEAVRWCREDAGMRIHGRTRRRPIEAFEADEKSLLRSPPTERYSTPRWSSHKVDRSHAVVVNYALYSVPYSIGECRIDVCADQQTVKMYRGGVLVKTHPRQPRGGTMIDEADLPPGKAELATRNTKTLCERADGYGPYVGEYARKLVDCPLPWTRMRFAYHLLGLAGRYGAEATNEACARALEAEVIDVKVVERMLEKGLMRKRLVGVPTPAPPRGQKLRFERPPSAFEQKGGPDASA